MRGSHLSGTSGVRRSPGWGAHGVLERTLLALPGTQQRGGAVPETRLRYMPGLDGLRAAAVTAVLLYHADVTWARGGYLGVDAFFVLSGFLITSLLLAEWQTRGAIDLPPFWLRAAPRLLPALFLGLVPLP